MAENTGKTPGAAEHKPNDQLELKKQEALMFLLDKTREFMRTDGEINEALKQLLSTIARHAEKDPRILFSGGDVEELFTEFMKTRPGGGSAGITGHDIVGGGLLADLADFIKQVGDFIKDEKKFFLAILLLIFCDNACDCICKFINKD
jgi:hypothetical protein